MKFDFFNLIFFFNFGYLFSKNHISRLSTDYTYKLVVNDCKISDFSPRHHKFTFQRLIKKFFIGDYAQILTTLPVGTRHAE
jgi:hypothetical protein